MTLIPWILAARPKTLGAAVAPVLVGSAVGVKLGQVGFDSLLFTCTLLSCMALQVATNWFNDALDHQKGADTAARLGPTRITAAGMVSPRVVFIAAGLMLVIATALSLPLVLARGWPMIAIGIPSLYFCFGYTGGPVPLAYRGLGELFVILFFGFVAVMGSAFVQCGQWLSAALLAGLQVGCLSTILIAVNNLRDQPEDSGTGKRTLAVRFGVGFAKVEITLLALLPLALGWAWIGYGEPRACWLPLISAGLPLTAIVFLVWTRAGRALNGVLALAGVTLLAFSAVLTWALVSM
jgi:1,4-dihydroxy-2-naphthoate polyprenyltransferase